MWQDVCDRFNRLKNERAPFRDYDAIRNKFNGLKGHKKPTGDPDCPPLVRRAKRLDKDIQKGQCVINLNSDDENDGNSIQDAQGIESEDDIVPGSDSGDDSLNSPVAAREGLNSFIANSNSIVEETLLPIVVEDSLQNSQPAPHNVPSDDGAGSNNDKDKRGAHKQDEHSGIFEAKKKFNVPPRLGKDAVGLNAMLPDVQEKNLYIYRPPFLNIFLCFIVHDINHNSSAMSFGVLFSFHCNTTEIGVEIL